MAVEVDSPPPLFQGLLSLFIFLCSVISHGFSFIYIFDAECDDSIYKSPYSKSVFGRTHSNLGSLVLSFHVIG